MSEETAHSKYSASGSSRWMNCPGSVKLSEGIESEESVWAAEGTMAHGIADRILKAPRPRVEAEKIKDSMNKKKHRDMVDHGLNFVREIEYRKRLTSVVLAETKVDTSPFTTDGQFGTVDCAIVDEFDRLVVVDYKYGAGVAVECDNNTQMLLYALGISHKYGNNFVDVTMGIHQPRAYHHLGSIREWTIGIDELKSWGPKFLKGVEECEKKSPRIVPGDWCRWCPAGRASVCSKRQTEFKKPVRFQSMESIFDE